MYVLWTYWWRVSKTLLMLLCRQSFDDGSANDWQQDGHWRYIWVPVPQVHGQVGLWTFCCILINTNTGNAFLCYQPFSYLNFAILFLAIVTKYLWTCLTCLTSWYHVTEFHPWVRPWRCACALLWWKGDCAIVTVLTSATAVRRIRSQRSPPLLKTLA